MSGGTLGELSEDIANGTMVGEYAIDGVLGEGGMGKVYAATHPIIAKRAAVKVLHPALSMDREAVERFVQEARSVNQIGHPNIVDIFAFGTLPDGRSYFVMEYLRGHTLRDRLRREPMPLAEALVLLDTIAQALEAAHEAGIVHRDLKPDNIFLVELKGAAPQVKLLDFGIAKLLGSDAMLTERTRTGNMMGTPAYMSPEQARGYAVDHRTDLYALGCVAFELVTGRAPYPSDNAADMIAQHLYAEVPSARKLRSDVPPELDALLSRLIAKDPAGRPSLAIARATLRRAGTNLAYLQSMLTTSPGVIVATPVSTGRRSPALVIGVVAALVIAIGVTVVVLVKQLDRGQSAPPTATHETHETMAVDKPAPAPPAIVAPPSPPAIVAPPAAPVVVPPAAPVVSPPPPAVVAPPPAPVVVATPIDTGKPPVKKPVAKLPKAPPPVQTSPTATPPKPKPADDDDDAPMRK